VQYKLQADLYKWHNEFNVRDYSMIGIRLEWYPLGTNKKL